MERGDALEDARRALPRGARGYCAARRPECRRSTEPSASGKLVALTASRGPLELCYGVEDVI